MNIPRIRPNLSLVIAIVLFAGSIVERGLRAQERFEPGTPTSLRERQRQAADATYIVFLRAFSAFAGADQGARPEVEIRLKLQRSVIDQLRRHDVSGCSLDIQVSYHRFVAAMTRYHEASKRRAEPGGGLVFFGVPQSEYDLLIGRAKAAEEELTRLLVVEIREPSPELRKLQQEIASLEEESDTAASD